MRKKKQTTALDGSAMIRLKVEYAKAGTVACSPRPRNVCEHQHGLGSWFPQECGPGVGPRDSDLPDWEQLRIIPQQVAYRNSAGVCIGRTQQSQQSDIRQPSPRPRLNLHDSTADINRLDELDLFLPTQALDGAHMAADSASEPSSDWSMSSLSDQDITGFADDQVGNDRQFVQDQQGAALRQVRSSPTGHYSCIGSDGQSWGPVPSAMLAARPMAAHIGQKQALEAEKGGRLKTHVDNCLPGDRSQSGVGHIGSASLPRRQMHGPPENNGMLRTMPGILGSVLETEPSFLGSGVHAAHHPDVWDDTASTGSTSSVLPTSAPCRVLSFSHPGQMMDGSAVRPPRAHTYGRPRSSHGSKRPKGNLLQRFVRRFGAFKNQRPV
ncbi:hypothetical protein WJX84_008580 [Apatococcus fuscideae]|uniref:Uncharacterized protein n=1 Tax=Apatococcus fuscideae TaxID=2026836 RepID=A0AAW1RSC8_9CHLO